MIYKIIALVIILILLILAYCLMAMAYEADEQAEKWRRKYERSNSEADK